MRSTTATAHRAPARPLRPGRWARVAQLAGAAAAVGLVLTACSSADAAGPDGGPASAAELGPLDALLEEAFGEWDEETAAADQLKVEELVAACMREQGFDYVPVVYPSFSSPEMGEEIDYTSREYAETYGFGVSTQPGAEPMPMPEGEEEFVDPNMEYVEAMSDSERDAYYAALYGVWSEEVDVDGEIAPMAPEDSGCQGIASHEVYGDGMVDDPRFEDLMNELNASYERAMTDPAIVALNSSWASCMADAGHPGHTDPNQAAQKFWDLSNEIYEDVDWGMTEADNVAAQAQIDAAFAAMRDDEIATALADYDCRQDVRYEDGYRTVDHARQQQLLDTYGDEITAWIETIKR